MTQKDHATDVDLTLKSLGQCLRNLRKSRKVTQEALAEEVGLSWITVNRLENASVNTQLDTLVAIAKALGVSLADVFAEAEGGTPRAKTGAKKKSKWEQIKERVDGLTAVEREWVAETLERMLSSPWHAEG